MELGKALIISFLIFASFGLILLSRADETEENQEDAVDGEEEVKVDDEKLEYAKGSLCNYCQYRKFCKLCDEDCPCETSASKPNCKMCKYCKYCYLGNKLCDTICTPGGIIDTVSAALINALPSHDPKDVEEDLDSVKEWIEIKKDEL